jgi:hypothetical protein
MTFWTKGRPFTSRSRTTSKLDGRLDSHIFLMRLLEIAQLALCLVAVTTHNFKLRLKASHLRLKLAYLTFKCRRLVKRKR